MARSIPGKQWLLPVWNGGHRLAWGLGEYLDAFTHRRFERCTVCGRFGPMLLRRRVIPPRLVELWGLTPPLAEALARKESLHCGFCGAKLRVRRLAASLLATFPVRQPPAPARSVAEWVRSSEHQTLRIGEINLIEGLHDQLRRLPGLVYSEYQDEFSPGTVTDSVRHEDLTRLTYPDGHFDLVLTSETLEHVPDLHAALREIRRVLVPGGWHLFTVPWMPGVPKTFPRTVLGPDGTPTHRAPPICHPGGDVGYPVFTEFGADLPDILRGAGFEVRVDFGPPSEHDLGQVFVCRRVA